MISYMEWSWKDPFMTKGTSNPEMARLGQILGFDKSWWQFWKKDPQHAGEEAMNFLSQSINDPKKIPQNSPFKVAYDKMNEYKNTINQKNKSNLDNVETGLLARVLINCHTGGNVPFAQLNQLWRRITGVVSDENQMVDPNKKTIMPDPKAAQLALNNDIHTPLHLLKVFLGIGGGIFSAPNNLQEIRIGSEDLIKSIYPKEYERLSGYSYSSTKKHTPDYAGQPGTAPQINADPILVNGLKSVLNFKDNPPQMAIALKQLLNTPGMADKLQKLLQSIK